MNSQCRNHRALIGLAGNDRLGGNDNLSGVSSDTDTDPSPKSNTRSASHGQTSDVKN